MNPSISVSTRRQLTSLNRLQPCLVALCLALCCSGESPGVVLLSGFGFQQERNRRLRTCCLHWERTREPRSRVWLPTTPQPASEITKRHFLTENRNFAKIEKRIESSSLRQLRPGFPFMVFYLKRDWRETSSQKLGCQAKSHAPYKNQHYRDQISWLRNDYGKVNNGWDASEREKPLQFTRNWMSFSPGNTARSTILKLATTTLSKKWLIYVNQCHFPFF
jgi:hypothetical protein